MWVFLFAITCTIYFLPHFGSVDLPSSYGLAIINIVSLASFSFLSIAAVVAFLKRTFYFPFIGYSFLCLLIVQPFTNYDPNLPQLRKELDISINIYNDYLNDRLSVLTEHEKNNIYVGFNIGSAMQDALQSSREKQPEYDINRQLFHSQLKNYIMKSNDFEELKYRMNLVKVNFNRDYNWLVLK